MAFSKKNLTIIPSERIVNQIFLIRGKKVMFDRDLAELYGVTTGNLNKAVRRNIKRFPEDFMFQLTKEELKYWIFQFGTSNKEKMGLRRSPFVFTEQGVAMLSSVLNSERAIQVNIRIIRAFTKLREFIITHKDLRKKIEDMERKHAKHDSKIRAIFQLIERLIIQEKKPKKQIGFRTRRKK